MVLSTQEKDQRVKLVSFVAGGVSGAASACLTAPLELVKTVLQCQARNAAVTAARSAAFGTLRTIVKEEGVRACFKGLTPTLIGITPSWGIYFAVYDSAKEVLIKSSHASLMGASVGASAVAGTISTVLTNPIWVVKTRMSTCRTGTYKSIMHCFSTIYRSEGVRPFFAGLGVSLLGLSHVCIQFPLYEYLKNSFAGLSIGNSIPFLSKDSEMRDVTGVILASSVSKIISTIVTYPHEVIRARLQNAPAQLDSSTGKVNPPGKMPFVERSSLFEKTADRPARPRRKSISGESATTVCRKIVAEEGVSALYAGMGINLLKAIPSSIITFVVYDYMSRFLRENYIHE